MPTKAKPFFLISDVDTETTKSRLAIAGIPYTKRRLESGPDNWKSIAEQLEQEPVAGVLVKLSSRSMSRLMLEEYRDAQEYLFRAIAAKPHVIFVHSSFIGLNLSGSSGFDDEDDPWFGPQGYFAPLEADERDWMLEFFEDFELNVVPYGRNAELSVLAADFIDSHQSNLLFRFYVPYERMYAAQTVEGLSLFRDYLIRALGLQIKDHQRTTPTGTVYEFFGDGELSAEDVANQLPDFRRVMGLSITDPSSAEALLVGLGVRGDDARGLVATYGTKSRRLMKDLRRERENKLISLRRQLEDELEEDLAPTINSSELAQVVDAILPNISSPGDTLSSPALRISGQGSTQVTVNLNPQIIGKVEGIVTRSFHGNQHIGIEAAQILEIIETRNGGSDLVAAVHEIEDPGSSPEKRLTAGRRLQGFLSLVGDKLVEKGVETGISSLLAYVQTKIGPLG